MKIIKTQDGEAIKYELEGRLDTITAPELQAQLGDLAGVKKLILDFALLDYISSAGLRVLLSAQKIMNMQGSMVVRHANSSVMEVFDVSGFKGILTIEN